MATRTLWSTFGPLSWQMVFLMLRLGTNELAVEIYLSTKIRARVR
jgi:hypothetical protein